MLRAPEPEVKPHQEGVRHCLTCPETSPTYNFCWPGIKPLLPKALNNMADGNADGAAERRSKHKRDTKWSGVKKAQRHQTHPSVLVASRHWPWCGIGSLMHKDGVQRATPCRQSSSEVRTRTRPIYKIRFGATWNTADSYHFRVRPDCRHGEIPA